MSNMVINTNVLALNSHRSLKSVGGIQSKASARLSSGLKINSAADDAAGLAISEKMRSQIRGLDMAAKNSQDAISLIQTAEGGMQEIDNMLQRVRELVNQSANDTNEHNDNKTGDRQKVQDEIDNLVAEIDSMAERVEFNKKKVINGDYDSTTDGTVRTARNAKEAAEATFNKKKKAYEEATAACNAQQTALDEYKGGTAYKAALDATDDSYGSTADSYKSLANAVTKTEVLADLASDLGLLNQTGVAASYTMNGVSFVGGSSAAAAKSLIDVDGNPRTVDACVAVNLASTMDMTINVTNATLIANQEMIDEWANTVDIDDVYASMEDYLSMTDKSAAAKQFMDDYEKMTDAEDNWKNDVEKGGKILDEVKKMQDNVDDAESKMKTAKSEMDKAEADKEIKAAALAMEEAKASVASKDNALYFQVGANADQGLSLNIASVKSDALGIGDGNGTSSIDVLEDTGSNITGTLDVLDKALSYVTTERSKLGAIQNRLEYTIKSLEISSENLSAAESRIRDTDMAKEMMNVTKANVLQQAATAMLTQANQAPQNVLQLLR